MGITGSHYFITVAVRLEYNNVTNKRLITWIIKIYYLLIADNIVNLCKDTQQHQFEHKKVTGRAEYFG